jgi:hypothetical protein
MVFIKKFTLNDQPISFDTKLVDDARGVWEMKGSGEPRVVKLCAVPNPMVKLDESGDADFDSCTVLYRARISTRNLTGRAYLEMWCRFPDAGESFSRGLDRPVSGSTDWMLCQTPFFLKKGERPDLIRLNVVIEGEGEVLIKDVELVAAVSHPRSEALGKGGSAQSTPVLPEGSISLGAAALHPDGDR